MSFEEEQKARAAARRKVIQAQQEYLRRHGAKQGRRRYESLRPFGPSNTVGTCLWCGAKLRNYSLMDTPNNIGRVGDYGDGYFCGLRCAYDFAVEMADNGRRFEPKKGEKANG